MRCGIALKIMVIFLSLEVISSQLNLRNVEQNNRPGLDLLSSFIDKAKENFPQLRMKQNVLGAIAARINHLTINGNKRGKKPNRQQNDGTMDQVVDSSTTTVKPKATENTTPKNQGFEELNNHQGTTTEPHVTQGNPVNVLKTTSKPKITRRPPVPGLPLDDDTTTVKTNISKRPPIPGLPLDDETSEPTITSEMPQINQGFFDILETTTAKTKVSKRPPIPGLPSEEDDAPKNCTVRVTDPTVTKKPLIPGLPSEDEEDECFDGVGNRIDPNALKSLIG